MNEVLKDKNGNIMDPKIPRYEKTTLYKNQGTGTAGSFTLNGSIANYRKIEINYHTNDNLFGTKEVTNPDGRSELNISISAFKVVSNNTYIKVREININGTQVTNNSAGEITINPGGNPSQTTSNYVYIDSVIGYK